MLEEEIVLEQRRELVWVPVVRLREFPAYISL
jgi:hypothetical protein